MKEATIIIIFGVIVAGIIIFLTGRPPSAEPNKPAIQNVSIVDGKQIIEIEARGGYNPRLSTARAGLPTIIRFKTTGSFDCSTSIRIPSLNINKLLPQTGQTDIDIGTPKSGSLLGTCGMGMYRFQIDFKV